MATPKPLDASKLRPQHAQTHAWQKVQPMAPSESGTKWLTGRLNVSGSSDRGEAQA